MRYVALWFVLVTAGCAPHPNGATNEAPAVAVYPPGIQAFKNPTAAFNAGLYISYATRDCCFIKQHAHLMFDKPAGARFATLYFFTPNAAPYKTGQKVTVSVPGATATGTGVGGKWVTVSLALPPAYISKTMVPVEIATTKAFNPAKLGINGDSRELSVVLRRVDFR